MKFGVVYNTAYYGVDPDAMKAVARHAEECGFESFYLTEHVALYPGASVGMTADDVAAYAAAGVTRLAVPAAADPAEQRGQLSDFVGRHRLG